MPCTFRLRTLILAPVAVGVLVWIVVGMVADQRRSYLRQRADSYAFGEADVLEEIAAKLAAARRSEGDGPEGRMRAEALRTEAEQLARVAAWHVKMERLYADAMERPLAPLPAVRPQP